MLPTLLRRAHDFSRRLIVRVGLVAFLSVLAIGLAKLFGGFIPFGLGDRIGADAVDHILSIIANSMLTVTTFSLTVMVASHRAVSSLWTPRAHQVLLQDTTTHTVLATFVGAYIYSVIVIILRETQVFEGEELVVLFFVTLAVVALIVFAILRWISHLELLGSLIETAQRIEDKAATAYAMRCEYPALGANAANGKPSGDVTEMLARNTGYIQQIYQDVLQDAAEREDVKIHIAQPVGSFIHAGEVLAWVEGDADQIADAIHRNVSIGTLRNYVQDPEFGLLNLTEIGQRALSPGVNDPGTAIDMIRRIARVLVANRKCPADEQELLYDRLWVQDFDTSVMLRDSIGAVLRCGLDQPEVVQAGLQSLKAMQGHGDATLGLEAARMTNKLQQQLEPDVFASG